MSAFLQHVVDMVSVGGLYALMALGIGLIFGIMRLINFAHGELIMVGGYATWLVVDLPGVAVIVLTLTIVVLFAIGMERIAFRPLRDASPATLLVAAFAVSYFLQNLALVVFGGRPKPFTFADTLIEQVTIAGLRIPQLQVMSLILTVLTLIGLAVILKRTSIGVQMRAAAQDFRMARLAGIRANRVIALAFLISGVLAWVVSLVYAAQIGQISPTMGLQPVIVGFVATVIGGLGSLSGAVIGGFLVGSLTVALQALLPGDLREFRDAFLFTGLLLVLLVRPSGIIATRALKERV
ncbi:MAG: branched-chain amino acid ABC transporter permease [Azospirillaceae bacterium]